MNKPLLSVNNLTHLYAPGKGFSDVSFDLWPGEVLGIVGESGSGKTTLMNLIGCLDLPTSGQYILKDQDMSTLNDNQLAEIRNKHIGFVFQNFYLLPKMTALDNVALPLLYAGVGQKERRVRAKEALESVGLADRIHFYPNQLSGGQQQRVALARALAAKPAIILADEPTGNLDSRTSMDVLGLMKTSGERFGQTIVMITHNPEIAEKADRRIRIEDGKIRA